MSAPALSPPGPLVPEAPPGEAALWPRVLASVALVAGFYLLRGTLLAAQPVRESHALPLTDILAGAGLLLQYSPIPRLVLSANGLIGGTIDPKLKATQNGGFPIPNQTFDLGGAIGLHPGQSPPEPGDRGRLSLGMTREGGIHVERGFLGREGVGPVPELDPGQDRGAQGRLRGGDPPR